MTQWVHIITACLQYESQSYWRKKVRCCQSCSRLVPACLANDGQVDQWPCFGQAAFPVESIEKGPPKCITWKSVEHQVEKGVKSSQRPGDDIRCMHDVLCRTSRVMISWFYPQHTQDVIWHKTYNKHHQDQYSHTPCSHPTETCCAWSVCQLFYYPSVTHKHHHKGK